MLDRVPVNPGRVLVTPENGGAAYYATLTRADNPTQEGTPLNKASLLKDATAAKFGLGTDAVPDDVFGALSRFQSGLGNEYVWDKHKQFVSYDYDETGTSSTVISGLTNNKGNVYLYYSDDFVVTEGNVFALTNASVTNFNASVSNTAIATVRGKYVIADGETGLVMYYVNTNATVTNIAGSTTNTPYKFTISSGKTYTNPKRVVTEEHYYLNSTDPAAYPPIMSDGYTYTALGQLGAKVQMATGSYAATGTYGSNNPNSLTFDFAPKIFAIAVQYSSNNQNNSQIFVLPKLNGNASPKTGGSCSISTWEYTKKVYTYASADGKTVYWYSADNATAQMNQSGFTYAYFAIG